MSARAQVLLWAQRVVSRKDQPPHALLEVAQDATLDTIQEAFHKVARTAHPDLHRAGLTAEELELVTSAYAAVAGAYQQMRTATTATQRTRPLSRAPIVAGSSTPSSGTPAPSSAPPAPAPEPAPAPAEPAVAPADPNAPQTPLGAAGAMSPKALTYYRKAELALRRGDLKSAMLQIKLAIAADPHSGFLRTALAEVELELKKG